MSTTYRMEKSRNEVRLTIIEFNGKSYEKREHAPSDATIDRFTQIANLAANQQRPDLSFSLLYSNRGFGWEIVRYGVRECTGCGKPIHEFDRKHYESGGNCFLCEIDAKIKARLEQEPDRITAPFSPRPEPNADKYGDHIYA